jgi:uncharacterized protein (TIGR03435 family)
VAFSLRKRHLLQLLKRHVNRRTALLHGVSLLWVRRDPGGKVVVRRIPGRRFATGLREGARLQSCRKGAQNLGFSPRATPHAARSEPIGRYCRSKSGDLADFAGLTQIWVTSGLATIRQEPRIVVQFRDLRRASENDRIGTPEVWLAMSCLPIAPAFLVVLSAALAAPAQSAPYVPTLTFEVTSVRECPPGPQINGFDNPPHIGRLTGRCVWVEQLIGWAFGVDYRVQVLNGPDWVRTRQSNEIRFDVQATSDSATDDKLAKLSDDQAKLEKQHMLQTLLADRFGLKTHMETRQEPAFALTVAKHGPKLQKGEPPAPRPEHFDGPWPAPVEFHRDPRGMEIVAHGASIGGASTWGLAEWLQFYLGKRVIDQTGIAGTYNFTLQFHGTLSDMETNDESTWPPVETAMQEQLGLQLKSTEAPLQVLVIDHIEMPSPN